MESIIFAAFTAGFLSFFSPCILPVATGIISIISGVSFKEITAKHTPPLKAGLASVIFVTGFSLCFSILGASSGAAGKLLIANFKMMFMISGILLVVLGVSLLDFVKLPAFTQQTKRFDFGKLKPGYLTAFIAGIAFAFAWTPCLGPVLASLLIMAAAEETALQGMSLLFVYSLGLGIPFIVYGFTGGYFINKLKKFPRVVVWAQRAMALIIIVVGLVFIFDHKSIISVAYSGYP